MPVIGIHQQRQGVSKAASLRYSKATIKVCNPVGANMVFQAPEGTILYLNWAKLIWAYMWELIAGRCPLDVIIHRHQHLTCVVKIREEITIPLNDA